MGTEFNITTHNFGDAYKNANGDVCYPFRLVTDDRMYCIINLTDVFAVSIGELSRFPEADLKPVNK